MWVAHREIMLELRKLVQFYYDQREKEKSDGYFRK